MRIAGIREARQNLSELIEEVKRGNEILITERGQPVARLIPAQRTGRPFLPHAGFRRRMPRLNPPASQLVVEEREDR